MYIVRSILLELKQYSALEYNMFYTAEITFSDPETMELVMTDSVVTRDREHELVRVLEKIFCERCGFNLKVHPAYRKTVESKGRKNSELRILEEARQILLHSKVRGIKTVAGKQGKTCPVKVWKYHLMKTE